MIATILALVVWTIVSIAYFLHYLGAKFRKAKWYDTPLLIPTLCIAWLIGAWCRFRLKRKNNANI